MKTSITIIFCLLCQLTTAFSQSNYHKLANGWYYIIEEDQGLELTLDNSNSSYYLDSMPIVVSKHIKEITFQNDNEGNPYLIMQFDSVGTDLWKFATMRSINRRLGFVFNNKLIQAPKVNSEISFGVAAIWDYKKDELLIIKSVLEDKYERVH